MNYRIFFLSGVLVLWPACEPDNRPPPDKLTVYNVCSSLPQVLCDGRRAACDETGVGGDREICLAREFSLCAENAREVHSGIIRFYPDRVEECAKVMKALPIVSRYDLGQSIEVHSVCNRIFEGLLLTGEECERDAQCKQPLLANQYSRCGIGQRCEVIKELEFGARCELESPANHYCGEGLGCSAINLSAQWGTCIQHLELGDVCNPAQDFALCGPDGMCDFETSTCELRLVQGERCYFDWNCASGHCLGDFCAPDTTMFSGHECGLPCLGDLCQ